MADRVNLRFHKMSRIYRLGQILLISQGLWSMELVSQLVTYLLTYLV